MQKGLTQAGLRQAGDPGTDAAFVGSGTTHAGGAVPDPPAVAGTTKFLREDASWAVPPAGTGDMLAASNLSDLANPATARTNLGLAALAASGLVADIADAGAAGRTWLQAATATIQTALLNVATTVLKGLLSAADKVRLDTVFTKWTGSWTTASSLTIPFAANQFSRIEITLDWDVQGPAYFKLTGLAAGSYNCTAFYCFSHTSSTGSNGASGADQWDGDFAGTATDSGGASLVLELPPAPRRKVFAYFSNSQFTGSGIAITRNASGYSTDVVNDPTALVVTFEGVCSGGFTARGYP